MAKIVNINTGEEVVVEKPLMNEFTICKGSFSLEEEGGTVGYFGMLLVFFCPFCLSSTVDMVKQMMDDFIQTLKTTPPAPGQEKVIVAGQPEWEAEQERSKNGIPLHHEVVEWFQEICNELEVPFIL